MEPTVAQPLVVVLPRALAQHRATVKGPEQAQRWVSGMLSRLVDHLGTAGPTLTQPSEVCFNACPGLIAQQVCAHRLAMHAHLAVACTCLASMLLGCKVLCKLLSSAGCWLAAYRKHQAVIASILAMHRPARPRRYLCRGGAYWRGLRRLIRACGIASSI